MEWLLQQWEWYRQNVEHTHLGTAVIWIGACQSLGLFVNARLSLNHRFESSKEAQEQESLDYGQPLFYNAFGRWLLWLGLSRD